MPYIITASGRQLDLPKPEPGQVCIEDIATHLARIPRFIGATNRDFSVAQHSLVVAYLAVAVHGRQPAPMCDPHSIIREGLIHDAHEAYIGDIPSPIKPILGEPYSEFIDSLDSAIRREFSLSSDVPHCVKLADYIALILESEELRGPGAIDVSRVPGEARKLMTLCSSEDHWARMARSIITQRWDSRYAREQFLIEWWRVN